MARGIRDRLSGVVTSLAQEARTLERMAASGKDAAAIRAAIAANTPNNPALNRSPVSEAASAASSEFTYDGATSGSMSRSAALMAGTTAIGSVATRTMRFCPGSGSCASGT